MIFLLNHDRIVVVVVFAFDFADAVLRCFLLCQSQNLDRMSPVQFGMISCTVRRHGETNLWGLAEKKKMTM